MTFVKYLFYYVCFHNFGCLSADIVICCQLMEELILLYNVGQDY